MTVPSINIPELNDIWQKAQRHGQLAREERPPIENLVLEGGGVKGFAYVGALEVMAENGMLQNIKRVAGSSAGGIAALLLALGCEPSDITRIMSNDLDMKSLLDSKHAVDPTRFFKISGMKVGVSDIVNLFENKGLFKGDAFVEAITRITKNQLSKKLKEAIKQRDQALLREMKQSGKSQADFNRYVDSEYKKLLDKYYLDDLGSITFNQMEKLRNDFPHLGMRELFITGTRLSNATLKVFSAETDPNMSIVDAVRITMSFPFAFEPILYQGEYYADGGIASNYPMDIFNQDRFLTYGRNDAKVNPCTLGLLLDSAAEIDARWGVARNKKDKLNLTSFAKKVIKGLRNRYDQLKDVYSVNSIQIFDNDLKTLDLGLTTEQIAKLQLSGRNALQQYVDHYMSDDTYYSHLPSYENVYAKYYAKSPDELIRIIEEDIWPSIQELNNFINILKKVDFPNELNKIIDALQDFPKALRDEQFSIYLQLEKMANELDNLTKESSSADKKLRAYHIKKRNLISNIEEATARGDIKSIASHQQAIIDLVKKISLVEEHKQSVEHEKLVFKENYLEIKKIIQPNLFSLIEQKQKLQMLADEQMLTKLRATETLLQEHLDIALQALTSHKRDYPDPRHNEKSENWLFDSKEQYRSELFKILNERDHLEETVAMELANERSDIFADFLQFGIKIPEAKTLTQHYFATQDIIARRKPHALLDMHANVERRNSRMRFFRRLVYQELEKRKILDETDFAGYENAGQFWERAVNEYLQSDPTIAQGYAEYLAKEKTVKHFSELTLRKKQQEYKTYKRQTKDKLDVEYALRLNEVAKRLGSGKWGNDILIENFADVRHNLANMDIVNGITYGRQKSEYSVSTIKTKASKKGRYKSSQRIFVPPPIEVHILTPTKDSLQNPVKKAKELIVMFNEPEKFDLFSEFSLAMKFSLRRKKQFKQHKAEIIKKIVWSLRQMQEQNLQPEDAIFKITIAGSGLAGQDAQYLFAAVIEEMRKNSSKEEFKRLKKIQLVLTDPARVSESLATKTAEALHELKKAKPQLRVKGYNLLHQRQIGLFKRNKHPYNYLGQANILSKLSSEDATVIADYRDIHDSGFQHQLLSNNTQPLQLEKLLNEGKYLYSNLFLRQISMYAKKLKNISKFLCFEFVPKVVGFLTKKLFNPPSLFKALSSPISRIAAHFRKKPTAVYDIPPWQSLLRANVAASNEQGPQTVAPQDISSIWQKSNDFIDKASPTKRLQRESKPPIENLVLEGGGTNSFAYLGAIKQLETDNLLNNLQRVAGSSAGGVVGALYSIGYSADELKDLLINQINLKDFLDEPYPFAGLGTLFQLNGMDVSLGGILSLFVNKGLYKGDNFKRFIEKLIAVKLEKNLKQLLLESLSASERHLLDHVPEYLPEQDRNKRIDDYLTRKLRDLQHRYGITDLGKLTFLQAEQLSIAYPSLRIKELYLTGTKMSDASLKIFSAETEPNMAIADAVRITMSFPGAFVPVNYQDEFYVDGGIAGTYPMQIFDREKYLSHGFNDAGVNPCTLGLLVDSKQEIEARWGIAPTETDEISFPTLIFKVLQGIHNRVGILRDKYNINSVQISDNLSENDEYNGSDKINFNISKSAKNKLYQNGQDALRFYNEQYCNASLQYSHLQHYTNLYEKYSAKSAPELKRILESEVMPLLLDFEKIEISLSEEKVRIQSHLHQLQTRLSAVRALEDIEKHLAKRDTYQFDLERTTKMENDVQLRLMSIDTAIAAKQRARNQLLDNYSQANAKIPGDVRERVAAFDKELAGLAQDRLAHANQHLRLTNKLTELRSQREAQDIALSQYDVAIVEDILTKQQYESKIQQLDRAFEAKSEILQERNILLRSLQERGVKIVPDSSDATMSLNRADPLLLSTSRARVQNSPQLLIGQASIDELRQYFPSHEWEYFNDSGSHRFHHTSHVDEIVQVVLHDQGRLLISGHPIGKLSQLANLSSIQECVVQADSLPQAKDFMRSLHLSGLDISRIRNIEIQGNRFSNIQQITAEILNLNPHLHKSRPNPYK